MDAGFVSTIRIKNSLIVAPLEVTPVLYMADGTAYTLPPVQLAISGVATVNVNAAVASAPPELAEHLSQFGSAALEYTYTSPGHVLGSIEILDVARSLIFTVPFNGAAGDNEHAGETWEGLWWRHQPEVGGYVSLANATGRPLEVSLQAIGSRGTALSPHTLELAAYATQLLNLDWLVGGLPGLENQAGGIRVQYEGRPGDLIVTGGLVNESIGYSANMPFWARDQHAGEPTKITYASVGMMLGDADPAAGFPGGTRFAPYAALRNTTANPLTVKPEVNFMAGSQPVTRALPDVQLGPFETRYFTFERLFEALGLRGLSGMINVAATFEGHPGDLVLAMGSTDQSGTYVFEVEPQGVGKSFSKEGHYWKVADGFDTMFTLWNPTDQAQDFLVTFFFGEEEARYKLPVSLGPKASTTIDVSKVIVAQQPDVDGHVIPLGTREGSFVFSSVRGMTEWMTLAASIGILNVQAATCGTECVSCCGYTAKVSPSSATIPVGRTVTLVASVTYCNGTTPVAYPNGPLWGSNNTSVATVNIVGVVTGVGPGSAGITARTISPVVIRTGTVCNQGGTCPTGYLQAGANVTVYDFTVNISPSTIRPRDTGGTYQMTITVQTNPFVSQSVTLQDVRIVGAAYGGHEPNHPTTFPPGTGGTFSPASGNTSDSDGKFTSTYTAPIFGGEHEIKATIQNVTKKGPINLRMKVEGLAQLIDGANFNLIGDTANHRLPNNHYGTSTANNGLQSIANQYAGQYPGSILLYNDQSLPWGGLFDIGPTPSCPTCVFWLPDHNEHRLGVNCDVDDTAVPEDRWTFLENLFRTNGFPNFAPEHNKHHWHLRP